MIQRLSDKGIHLAHIMASQGIAYKPSLPEDIDYVGRGHGVDMRRAAWLKSQFPDLDGYQCLS